MTQVAIEMRDIPASPGTPPTISREWPEAGVSRVPYWIYSDPEVYAEEQKLIFQGPSLRGAQRRSNLVVNTAPGTRLLRFARNDSPD